MCLLPRATLHSDSKQLGLISEICREISPWRITSLIWDSAWKLVLLFCGNTTVTQSLTGVFIPQGDEWKCCVRSALAASPSHPCAAPCDLNRSRASLLIGGPTRYQVSCCPGAQTFKVHSCQHSDQNTGSCTLYNNITQTANAFSAVFTHCYSPASPNA